VEVREDVVVAVAVAEEVAEEAVVYCIVIENLFVLYTHVLVLF
jgi:hypothetical protein